MVKTRSAWILSCLCDVEISSGERTVVTNLTEFPIGDSLVIYTAFDRASSQVWSTLQTIMCAMHVNSTFCFWEVGTIPTWGFQK